MTRVLITGGHGIIGRHAVARFLELGHEVHALGRHSERPSVLANNVHWHPCDLLTCDDFSFIHRIQPNICLHLAWTTEHGLFWQSPDNLNWVASSVKLLRAFAESGGTRFVAAGSCAEYDWRYLGSGPCNNETPLGSPFLYGIAKDALRRLIESYCTQMSLSYAWGRIFLLYGEGESKKRLVSSVIHSLLAGEMAQTSHGHQIRDMMSTRDCGHAFAELAVSSVQGTLNIASGIPVTLQEVIETIRVIIGSGKVDYGAFEPPKYEPPVLFADTTTLAREVEFMPADSLEQGLRRLITDISQGRCK